MCASRQKPGGSGGGKRLVKTADDGIQLRDHIGSGHRCSGVYGVAGIGCPGGVCGILFLLIKRTGASAFMLQTIAAQRVIRERGSEGGDDTGVKPAA